MSLSLSLNCFILGDDSDQVFTVEIQMNKNVSILKDLIKETKSSRFHHIDPSDLILSQVSLAVDTIKPELTVDDIETCQTLHPVKKISSVFGEALVDEHVHILVQAPTVNHPVAAPDPTQLLSLNCFVVNENQIFTVEIPMNKNVSILKDLIKEKQSPRLNHVVASKLILSQVSLPDDANLKERLKNVDLVPLKSLLPLSQLFPSVEENCLHVVVQEPTNEDLGSKDAGGEDKRDRIPTLHKRFQNAISCILAPADSAKSSHYTRSQIPYSIYDGRYKADGPRTSIAPPIQLFHPAFGHFLDSVKSDHALPDDMIRQTAEYMKAASAIYKSKGNRRQKLTPLLCAILDVNIQSILNEDKTNPDGIVEVMKDTLLFLFFLQEGFGDGDSDPSIQAGLSAGRCWAQSRYEKLRNATACPTFFVATAGPWIAILGAVITDSVIVQRLTDYIWVGLDSVLNESHITHVARVFNALKTSMKKLNSYYDSLHPTSDLPAGSRYFPSITTYRLHGGERVKFEYVGFLENRPDCTTLRARTQTKPAQDIVVKFVDRYGERAHQILAAKGLAPKLLYCASPHLDDDEPSYQSISMVVMEYLDGNMFAVAKQKMSEESVKRVRSAVQDALELLHCHGLVFGDLRPPNVMITKNDQVKLIDFNWAGEEGQAKYPSLINLSGIPWPEGVKALALMRREHDIEMLNKLN